MEIEKNKKYIIDIVKYKWLWLGLTALLLLPGIIAMIYSTVVNKTPLLVGIDFTGGTMLQYGFEREITKEDEGKIRTILNKEGIGNAIIQVSAPVTVKTEAKTEEVASEDTKENTAENATEAKAEEKVNTEYVVSIKTRYLE